MKNLRLVLFCVVAAFSIATPAVAQSVADFYKGKQVVLIVGAASGGGYDSQGRLLARHIGKHIPGNPTVIVQNMPGAGSLQATNHLYNIASKDGTFFGLIQRDMLVAKAMNAPGVRFEIEKF
jgi:tripartite-type tricarboxylate transporter receptor subunit TctC